MSLPSLKDRAALRLIRDRGTYLSAERGRPSTEQQRWNRLRQRGWAAYDMDSRQCVLTDAGREALKVCQPTPMGDGVYEDGRWRIERDIASYDEWDVPSEHTWFVYDTMTQNMDVAGPPDALYEARTKADAVEWIRGRY